MSQPSGFTDNDVPNQTGKCFVVTGANTGLGFEISRVLAAHGARVLMACRDRAKADAAMARLKQQVPAANLTFLRYDQADLDSIRAAADQVAREPRVDVLINNAGVMNPPLTRTRQGFELQFGVNHLGCFAFTSLLLPKLAENAGARVVITSSLVHKTGKIDWSDLNADNGYERRPRYDQSKLANILFLFELDRRLRAVGSSITAVGCHPGFATTELGRHIRFIGVLKPLFGLIANTPAMGAWPALQAATGIVQAGGYYGPQGRGEIRGPSGEAARAPQAVDPDLARRLWDVSIAMTGVDPGLLPAS
ncbi:putative Retinol dehydrogenase [Bradyrhizobium sp. ORS 285]|uniref:oxidoreductase n=1 Tax=Bradyrhizobium sp. ORS 285 TaxID=115808 RepID=UPI0002405B7E|nr:oxidoreductase [Bradyrhizobium sp. ORS 285]CCD84199.1 putative Retinol dehydrogenase [Bradyrhizobium sp. ORS 285]SMX55774.1 putative Retinol dehydrogenase [Bradyrhizobium sp. ORS 285]